VELGHDDVAVGHEDPRSAADFAQVGAEVVLQLLDADRLGIGHAHKIATGSHIVKPGIAAEGDPRYACRSSKTQEARS
jgi:hypothetical protein